MDERGTFSARILDTGLRGLAASAVLRERDALRERGVALPSGAFEDMIRDTESRLLHLAEALATGRPALFVGNVEWSRSTYASRGLPDEHLALHVRCLREELSAELPPNASEPALRVLDEAAQAFDHPPVQVGSILESDGPHADRIRRMVLAVLEGRRDDALDLILAAAEKTPIDVLQSEVLVPVQHEIGSMWQRGEIHVHEEHVCSKIVEEALVLLGGMAPRREGVGKRVVVGSVSGNLHDIGARLIADRFQMDGWDAVRLGASMPGEDLVRAVTDYQADLLALSVTMSLHVRSTASIIRRLRDELGESAPPVLVGGPPFSMVPDLWQAVGADGTATNAGAAVQRGAELVGVA